MHIGVQMGNNEMQLHNRDDSAAQNNITKRSEGQYRSKRKVSMNRERERENEGEDRRYQGERAGDREAEDGRGKEARVEA